MKKLEIEAEYSAQATLSKPNPLVREVFKLLATEKRFGLKRPGKVVDLGCGKLRHLQICTEYFKYIVLVDTKKQIARKQKFGGMICTMTEYAASLSGLGKKLEIQTIEDFESQHHNAEVILSAAVMDVVLKTARVQMINAAFRNLRPGGYFVIIIPRNDSSILTRCQEKNRYEDGYVFKNRGQFHLTFYTNYRDHNSLVHQLTSKGFNLVEDFSVYRHVCLVLQRPF